jgi:hypothetical protein
MKLTCLLLAGAALTTLSAHAISISSLGSSYTQDFNILASSGTGSATPAGWSFAESGSNQNTTYAAGTGSSNGGDTYSFGAASASDRAFGGLRSGSLIPTFGAFFSNDTGGGINFLDIAYSGEQWRMGAVGRLDRLDFQYSTDATSLTTGNWIGVGSLDFTAPSTTGSVGARDGNVAANRTGVSSTITGLTIAPGAGFWIRWADFNADGSDDGLAVDDFSLTARAAVSTAGVPDSLPSGIAAALLLSLVIVSRWIESGKYALVSLRRR